jgi:hypothetical protein
LHGIISVYCIITHSLFACFQFRFTTGGERLLLFIGFLGSLATGATAPLNVWLFGELTGAFVEYGIAVQNGSIPDQDAFLDAVQRFSGLNSLLGLEMLLVTYVSVWSYNFVASRQVRKNIFTM